MLWLTGRAATWLDMPWLLEVVSGQIIGIEQLLHIS
jgi:hypothetical protein